jgi:hypothetical protein
MKRRTLDLMASAGGLLIAAILLVAGLVLTANANFASAYVADQMGEQKITFPAVDELSDAERANACLIENAGLPLTTGKQAECYANNYIGVHLQGIAGGKTYAELGDVQSELRAKIAEAQAADSPDLADLQAQLQTVTQQRETLFKGETLRGLLLTSYGFSELGAKASLAATVAYTGAGLLFLLSVLGFWHAARTPATEAFAAPAPARERELVNA